MPPSGNSYLNIQIGFPGQGAHAPVRGFCAVRQVFHLEQPDKNTRKMKKKVAEFVARCAIIKGIETLCLRKRDNSAIRAEECNQGKPSERMGRKAGGLRFCRYAGAAAGLSLPLKGERNDDGQEKNMGHKRAAVWTA